MFDASMSEFLPSAKTAAGKLSIRMRALLCGTSLVLLASPAMAQQAAAPEPAASPDSVGEIVVTGSRIARSGFTAPTPVTVLSTEQLLASSPSTVAAALNNLPSLVSNFGPNANGGSQSVGRNTLNLRGLGITRTLTLLDGHRFPATSTDNTVDTNLLPQGLIQRAEVVTGGASAAYGSDAVAGVINFVLDRNFTGVKAAASYGVSNEGDGQEQKYNFTLGRDFLGGRAHVLADVEYFDNDGIPGDAREFRRRGASIISNPAATVPPTAANPTRVRADFVRVPATFGGLITAAAGGSAAANAGLVGIQFLPGGVPAPYNFGTLATSSNQSGGDGVNTAILQPINRPLHRKTAFLRGTYELTDNVTMFLEGAYATSGGIATTKYYHTGANALTIRPDNAYLPASIRQQMTAGGVTSLTMTRYEGEPNSYLQVDNYTTRLLGGFEGKIGGFKWEAFYQYGLNRQTSPNYDMYIFANYTNAVDAVVNPANGQIVCRSSLASPGNGCVPLNPFGAGSPSPASLAYVNGTNYVRTRVQDETGGANISGELFNNWAGPVSIATGVDYRRVQDLVVSNAIGAAGGFFTGGVAPWAGGYTIWEGFGELDVPLARDMAFAKLLDLNLAARYADYSTSGGATTWKAGLVWKPVDDLRLRVTRSRDIRAPNPGELFRAGIQQTFNLTDPFRANARTAGVAFISRGNPDLLPEVADTLVAGFVYQPSWIRGLDFSVDHYNIKIKDAIANLSPQQYIDRCFQGSTELCSAINRNAAGVITGGFTTNFNFTSLETNGVDIEASYRVPGQDWFSWWRGSLSVRGILGYIGKLQTTTPGATPVNRAGDAGGSTPHWRGLFTANYDVGAWSSFLQVRYIGGGAWDSSANETTTNFNDIAPAAYLDAQVTWHVKPWVDVGLNVQNLLNKQPPFAPLNSNYNVPTNADLYDQIGRYFRMSVKFRH